MVAAALLYPGLVLFALLAGLFTGFLTGLLIGGRSKPNVNRPATIKATRGDEEDDTDDDNTLDDSPPSAPTARFFPSACNNCGRPSPSGLCDGCRNNPEVIERHG